MVSLTLAVIVVVAVTAVVLLTRTVRDPNARARYWAAIAEILDDDSLSDAERNRLLEARYASRPFR